MVIPRSSCTSEIPEVAKMLIGIFYYSELAEIVCNMGRLKI